MTTDPTRTCSAARHHVCQPQEPVATLAHISTLAVNMFPMSAVRQLQRTKMKRKRISRLLGKVEATTRVSHPMVWRNARKSVPPGIRTLCPSKFVSARCIFPIVRTFENRGLDKGPIGQGELGVAIDARACREESGKICRNRDVASAGTRPFQRRIRHAAARSSGEFAHKTQPKNANV